MLDDVQLKRFYIQLGQDGLEKVRDNLVRGIYGANEIGSRAPLVQEWIWKQEETQRELDRLEETRLIREANSVAKDANAIAQRAASAARGANARSTIAIVLALAVLCFEIFKWVVERWP